MIRNTVIRLSVDRYFVIILSDLANLLADRLAAVLITVLLKWVPNPSA